jgi:hypothetical protein
MARPITADWQVSQDSPPVKQKPKKAKAVSQELYDIDPRFGDVRFLVDATHFEKYTLWERNETYKAGGLTHIKTWEQGTGLYLEIGRLDGRPVTLNFWFEKLDGVTVVFYEAASQVVDHRMIEEWLEKNLSPKWDKGTRRAHCDAANFHHAVQYVTDPSNR